MLKRARCTNCGSVFYTADRDTVCGTCSGATPNFDQAEKDEKIVRRVNRRKKLKEPQQVDPRAHVPTPTKDTEDQSED
ncbi:MULTISPECIES: hypothetical protein [unclassified Aminobacter]|uniref:hypothetical protein n=1 Tax=unclassified Aminobacter TaxID=2644704 RepID=UPI0004665F36|nr:MULTISPECIES: hypothetical protein [unclassified Aminobacter]TWH35567.1 hypothetical protein L611_001200000480 [Aminobacter sp. J15]